MQELNALFEEYREVKDLELLKSEVGKLITQAQADTLREVGNILEKTYAGKWTELVLCEIIQALKAGQIPEVKS